MSTNNTVGMALGNAGPRIKLEHNGIVFEFFYPCMAGVAKLEQLVAKIALQNVNELQSALDPIDFAALKADVMAKIQAKKHAFGGELFLQITSGTDSAAMFLWSYLPVDSAITLEQVRDLLAVQNEECTRVALELTPDFCRAAGKLRNIPAATMERILAAVENDKATQEARRKFAGALASEGFRPAK